MELRRHRVTVVLAIGTLTLLSYFSGFKYESSSSVEETNNDDDLHSDTHRKLLGFVAEPERIRGEHSAKCAKGDVMINQGPSVSFQRGIPSFTVEIMNLCFTGCNISDIHIKCGKFSSDKLVNPNLFRRLSYDDCLVNNGQPMKHGQLIRFVYTTTFQFPLSVSSVRC